jgi:hypothetical protein
VAFRLEPGEPAPDAIRRIAAELVADAVEGLTGGGDRGRAVHGARTSCKRLRAVLRLVRPQLA